MRSDRFPRAPPSTAARQTATARPRARTARAAATPAMTKAASVTRTGYPTSMPPLAPGLRTSRTAAQPVPATGCDASTSALLTWSAATTAIATMATRTRGERTALSSGTIAIPETIRPLPSAGCRGQVGVAGVQAAPQVADLRVGQARDHRGFQRADRIPVAVEQPAARGRQGDDQAPAVGLVAVPFDQAPSLQCGDHVSHGLGRDEGVAGELRRGKISVPLQHGERRVLQRGQPGGAQQVVQV